MNGLTSLPVLDLSRLHQGEEQAAAFRLELREAAHEVGFFYLVGHGVSDELTAELLATGRRFFALPEADKTAIEMLRSPHFRGYTRTGGELTRGRPDWREQIDIGPELPVLPSDPKRPYLALQGPNQWPEALPELADVMGRWEAALREVSMTLMRAWAESLGSPPDVFDAGFAHDPAILMKIVRYPGRAVDEARQGVGAHKDPGILTILLVDSDGLQVGEDDELIDAPMMPGAFIVNIGELLEVATEGYLKATVHRVVSPPEGTERISVPYFFNPALDAVVPTLSLPPELAARSTGVTVDPDNPLFTTYGENQLKSRLRAHPDVAARHYPKAKAG